MFKFAADNGEYKKTLSIIILVVISAGVFVYADLPGTGGNFSRGDSKNMEKIVVKSSAFENNENIPPQYTCDGDNINPPLEISGVNGSVKSLALIVDDPDAPTGTWTHWIVWNIHPKTATIEEEEKPEGVEGENSSGEIGYRGPCPPSGTHRYFFKIFGLDTVLKLEKGSGIKDVEDAMEGHVIQKGELVGLYKRD